MGTGRQRGLVTGAIIACLFAVPCVLAGRPVITQRRRQLSQCASTTYPVLYPNITHAPVVDLAWVGTDDQVVFAITRKASVDAGGLWRSKNGGASWAEMTGTLNGSISYAETVNIIGVYSQRSSPNNVLFLSSGTYMWLSHDFGETVTPHQTPNKWRGSSIKAIRVHPWRDWVLLLVKRPDCKSLDHVQIECPFDLMLCTDPFTGWTWQNLTKNSNGKVAGFVDFDWASNLCPTNDCTDIKMPPEQQILATMYAKADQYDQPWDPDVNFVATTDNFVTFQTHVMCGNMFEIIGHHIYLAFANSCPTDIHGKPLSKPSEFPKGITLYTSSDDGDSFIKACLPVALKQEGYELMETHDGRGAVVIVDFEVTVPNGNTPITIPASSVYTAGPHHALFSLSMTDVYHADFGYATDFTRIEGVPGIYIANQMLTRPTPPNEDAMDYYDLSDLTSRPLVESRITFNAGGTWDRIPAPSSFNNAPCDRCDGAAECYLHLHGMSAWESRTASMPAVYSNPSAPGLIMATGNVAPVGHGLDDNDGVCTWLSSDGGVTWSDVAQGAYIYEYMDWGGLIAMARHPGSSGMAAEEIKFSVDYGRCWRSVPLKTALLVDNIRIEPDGQRPYVIVHGRACRKPVSDKCTYNADDAHSANEGVLYTLNLAQLAAPGVDPLLPCGPNDYDTWTVPTTTHTPRCVLGRQMAFARRKVTSLCINGGDYKRPPAINTTCDCVQSDVECDYGYIRNGAKCSKITKERMPTCPMVDQGVYTVSQSGLRIVHGDVCNNITAVIMDTDGAGTGTSGKPPAGGGGSAKPSSSGHGGAFYFVLLLFITIVVCGGFAAWWIYAASESQRDMMRDIAGNVAYWAASLWAWVLDKISSLRGGRATSADQDLGYFQPLGDVGAGGGSRPRDDDHGIFTLK